MKKIKLTQGKYAVVDNKDYVFLMQWKWHLSNTGYPSTNVPCAIRRHGSVQRTIIRMHQILLKPKKNYVADHINRNKLDNRQKNLRLVTRLQNNLNVGLRKDNTSGHTGIAWYNPYRKWRVRYAKKTIGYFSKLSDAIKAKQNYYERIGVSVSLDKIYSGKLEKRKRRV